jgi:hypothetical protein
MAKRHQTDADGAYTRLYRQADRHRVRRERRQESEDATWRRRGRVVKAVGVALLVAALAAAVAFVASCYR